MWSDHMNLINQLRVLIANFGSLYSTLQGSIPWLTLWSPEETLDLDGATVEVDVSGLENGIHCSKCLTQASKEPKHHS